MTTDTQDRVMSRGDDAAALASVTFAVGDRLQRDTKGLV